MATTEDLYRQRIATLENQVQELERDLAVVSNNYHKHKTDYHTERMRADAIQMELAACEAQLSTAKTVNAELRMQLTEKDALIASALDALDTLEAGSMQRAQQQAELEKSLSQAAEIEVKQLQQENNQYKVQLANTLSVQEELQAQLKEHQQQLMKWRTHAELRADVGINTFQPGYVSVGTSRVPSPIVSSPPKVTCQVGTQCNAPVSDNAPSSTKSPSSSAISKAAGESTALLSDVSATLSRRLEELAMFGNTMAHFFDVPVMMRSSSMALPQTHGHFDHNNKHNTNNSNNDRDVMSEELRHRMGELKSMMRQLRHALGMVIHRMSRTKEQHYHQLPSQLAHYPQATH